MSGMIHVVEYVIYAQLLESWQILCSFLFVQGVGDSQDPLHLFGVAACSSHHIAKVVDGLTQLLNLVLLPAAGMIPSAIPAARSSDAGAKAPNSIGMPPGCTGFGPILDSGISALPSLSRSSVAKRRARVTGFWKRALITLVRSLTFLVRAATNVSISIGS